MTLEADLKMGRLLDAIDGWAVQRARYMTLETIASIADSDLVKLPPQAV